MHMMNHAQVEESILVRRELHKYEVRVNQRNQHRSVLLH